MKKFFSLVLALVMALSLTTVAFGATTELRATDTASANAALAAAVTDTTVILEEGDYGELTMVNTAEARTNITIVGEGTVTVDLIAIGTSSSLNNITFKNIIFDGEGLGSVGAATGYLPGIHTGCNINGMNVIGCTFKNSATLVVKGTATTADILVDDCVFDNTNYDAAAIGTTYCSIAVGGSSNDGVTVQNCEFINSAYSAIQVNGTVNGDVTIVGNKIDGTKDRALRLGNVQGDVVVTIEDTTFVGTDCVDDDGEVMKISSVAAGATVSADVPAGTTVNVGDAILFDGAFSGMTLNAAGEITGGTFSDDVSAYLADGLAYTMNTAGEYVIGTPVVYGDKFDLYLADKTMTAMLALETPAVSGLTFDEKGAKTNADGSGNVAYIVANNGDYYVKTTTPTTESYAVTAHGKTTVLYYVDVVDTASANVFYYTAAVKEFTNFGLKCGQLYVTPTATQTFFQTVTGIVYLADDASTDISMNYLLDGEVVGVDPLFVTVANQQFVHYGRFPIDHNFAVTNYTYDSVKKVNVPTEATCTTCLLKTTNIYKDGKVPATYTEYPLNAAGYVVGLAPNTVIPSAPVVTPSTDKVTSADTFDAGIAMYVGMSVMAAAGSAVVIGKKKD